MDFINFIEVRGRVGSVTFSRFGDAQQCRMSVVTEYVYKDRAGAPVMETVWFYASAWEGKYTMDMSKVEKGSVVQLDGRIRTFKYTSTDGTDRYSWEIAVNHLKVLETDEPLSAQPSIV